MEVVKRGKSKSLGAVIVSIMALIGFGISSYVATANAAAVPKPAVKSPAKQAAAPAWETEWNNALAAAKKEGKVVIFSSLATDARIALGKSFKARYGIEVEWVAGRGAEAAEKFFAERRGGIYSGDLFIIGGITPFVSLKPAGVLEPLKPLLILPEVTNPKVWYGGGLWFADNARSYVSSPILTTAQYVVANSTLVKKGEITSYKDLLNPKWKGKIVLNDPTTVGAGSRWFACVAEKIMGVDYMKELAKQEVAVVRDQRLQMEWISRGKYSVILGPQPTITAEFMTAGAPLMPIEVAEGSWLGGGPGLAAYINKAPHPNAAKVFLNWFHGREGQAVYGKVSLTESARLDVSNEYLDPSVRRQPNVKYFISEDEDFLMKFGDLMKVAGQIFAVGK